MAKSNREYDEEALYRAIVAEDRNSIIREEVSNGEIDFHTGRGQATISITHHWKVSSDVAQRILRALEDDGKVD